MKIKILQDEVVLKEINLTPLQLKSVQLTGQGQKPEDCLAVKIQQILNTTIAQAKQIIDRISPLTEVKLIALIDEIEEAI